MKKILVLALAGLMLLSSLVLVGCEKEKETNVTTSSTQKVTTTTTNPTTTLAPTTTTTKQTTTTTEKTTDYDDYLAEQMLLNSKYIKYTVPNVDDPTLFGDAYDDPMYRVINSYSECRQLLAQAQAWYSALEYFRDDGFNEAFDEYTEEFFAKNSLLLIENPSEWQFLRETKIQDICLNGNDLNIYIYENSQGVLLSSACTLFFIPIPKSAASRIDEINIEIDMEEWDGMVYKPVIYLYPEEETNVCVKLGNKDKITVSYPEYVDGWNVLAKPDGKLVYTETGRNLYSLYYESESVVDFKIEKDGFVVKKEDIAEFFEEKLAILGLNEYEAEEFIIYWLPILQANEYNYIRFATADEIERNMPLEINPNPDSIIRVIMTYKGLDAPIEVEEQKLTTPDRTGFVAVEWGGTQIVG